MIVVGIVSLIASIAVPYFVTYRASAQAKTCVANLKQLQGAKEQWATEQRRGNGDPCDLTDIVGTDKYIRNPVACPSAGGADYLMGAVGENPRCPTTLTDHVLP